ncbi:hypothetical protein BHM03_00014808 [Ensete ventricosum]|nr:hypothetical protein BHM03_00014808 [Ensete ventricosum]
MAEVRLMCRLAGSTSDDMATELAQALMDWVGPLSVLSFFPSTQTPTPPKGGFLEHVVSCGEGPCRNGLLPFSYFGLLFYPSSLLVSPPRAGDRRNSGSESGQSEPCSSSSGVMTRIDIKAFLALEVMKSCYGFDSTLTVESLVMIQKRYSIPDEYGLHASFLGQRTYDAYPGGFSISIDALDVRLSATKSGGCPGLASRAPTPIAPIIQLSSDVEEMKVSNHHKSRQEGEGSKSCPSKGKEQGGPAGETQAPRPHRSRSVKKLDQISAGEGDVGYHTLRMTDLPLSDPDVPLEAQWPNLKQGTKVWVDGAASREYDRGVLIPRLAADLYS